MDVALPLAGVAGRSGNTTPLWSLPAERAGPKPSRCLTPGSDENACCRRVCSAFLTVSLGYAPRARDAEREHAGGLETGPRAQ